MKCKEVQKTITKLKKKCYKKVIQIPHKSHTFFLQIFMTKIWMHDLTEGITKVPHYRKEGDLQYTTPQNGVKRTQLTAK